MLCRLHLRLRYGNIGFGSRVDGGDWLRMAVRLCPRTNQWVAVCWEFVSVSSTIEINF